MILKDRCAWVCVALAWAAGMAACESVGNGGPSDKVREVPASSEPAQPRQRPYVDRPRGRLGQTLYLPIYSSIFVQSEKVPLEMTITITVRNTAEQPISLDHIEYVGTKGETLEEVVAKAVEVGPQETREYLIRVDDKRGGRGANFLVEWHAQQTVSPPLVQAVHVHLGGQAFAFLTNAVVVDDRTDGAGAD